MSSSALDKDSYRKGGLKTIAEKNVQSSAKEIRSIMSPSQASQRRLSSGALIARERRGDSLRSALKQRVPDAMQTDTTFLTSVDVHFHHLPVVDGMIVSMSEDLKQRLEAMAQLIGLDGMKLLSAAVHAEMTQVCRISRAAERSEMKKMNEAQDFKDVMGNLERETQRNAEVMERIKALEEQTKSLESDNAKLQEDVHHMKEIEQQQKHLILAKDSEINRLKEEVETRGQAMEELRDEKSSLEDKLRRKEVEILQAKKSLDVCSSELRKMMTERDFLYTEGVELKTQLRQECRVRGELEETCERLKTEQRVARRNFAHQMPEEFRKVCNRIEELEKVNKQLKERLAALEGTGESGENSQLQDLVKQLHDVMMENKLLTEKVEKLRAEKDTAEKKYESETRVLENRGKALLQKNAEYSQRLEGESNTLMSEKMKKKSFENEIVSLKKRNIELMGQLNKLEESKMIAEKAAQDATSRARTLQEKLDMLSSLQKVNMGKLQFSEDVRTEEVVDHLLGFSRISSSLRPPSTSFRPPSTSFRPPSSSFRPSSASLHPPSHQRPPSSPTFLAPASRPVSAVTTASIASSRATAPHASRPASASHFFASTKTSMRGSSRPASANQGDLWGGEIGKRRDAEEDEDEDEDEQDLSQGRSRREVEKLLSSIAKLEERLNEEEAARVAAQEKMLMLSERLEEEERKKREGSDQGKKKLRLKGKHSQGKMRELEAQNLILFNKLREIENVNHQLLRSVRTKEDELEATTKKLANFAHKLEIAEEQKAICEEKIDQLKRSMQLS